MISIDELLKYELDPVPRYILLRDVLKMPMDNHIMVSTKKEILQTKWVKDIIELQQEDGSFGHFHSLSVADKYPMTTEQALRRLRILGLDYSDLCIQKAVTYMEGFLRGELDFPDRKEKMCDWTNFTYLIAAAQIRRFCPSSKPAFDIANKWRNIITYAFSGIEYSQTKYNEAYESAFLTLPRGGRLADFVNFYPLALLYGILPKDIEDKMLDYVINHSEGIYYIYESSISRLPAEFSSKQANRYLNAIELLSGYSSSKEKLSFVSEWLLDNCDERGFWDMGSNVKDGVTYPLSNSWRNSLNRKLDYTVKIASILKRLGIK